MEESRFGFVYIWYDRKRKMYYIGSHWGSEDDPYICSSNRMRKAYRRRTTDFKRRVLERHESIEYKMLLEREEVWLQKIDDTELGKRYYNLRKHAAHWAASPYDKLSIREKMSANHWSKNSKYQYLRIKGPMSEEQKEKLRQKLKGRKLTDEWKQKIKDNHASKKPDFIPNRGMLGKHHREESKLKSSLSQSGEKNHMFGKTHSEEARRKISEASKRMHAMRKATII